MMKTIKQIGILILLNVACFCSQAQTDKALIRQGNNEYKNGNYADAEIKYRKSLDQEYNPKAQFNLGDALYEQGNFEAAEENFSEVTKRNTSQDIESEAYYNLGNTLMAQEKYAEAFEAYKNS